MKTRALPRRTGYRCDTVVRFVQGAGDPWGTLADVEAIAASTPRRESFQVHPGVDRYGGYSYVEAHAEDLVAFFKQHLHYHRGPSSDLPFHPFVQRPQLGQHPGRSARLVVGDYNRPLQYIAGGWYRPGTKPLAQVIYPGGATGRSRVS